MLAGEVGTGKTTMLECLRDFLNSQQIAFASLFNSRLTVEQFFEMLAYDLELRCNRRFEDRGPALAEQMLLERAGAGRTTVLIIDEAHNLEWDVLEEVRLLGNLENRRGKMLQIILAGQPELDRKMDAPEFRQLKQRIALRCTLAWLQPAGVHRIRELAHGARGAEGPGHFCSRDLLEEIHRSRRRAFRG